MPIQIGTDTNWQKVEAGYSDTKAIKSNGTLWGWGSNEYGELGNGTNTHQHTPLQAGTADDWQQLMAGNNHTAAMKNDGTFWIWGLNSFGELGDGTNTNKNTPVQIGCPVTSTKSIVFSNSDLQLFPNPTQAQLTIQTTNVDPTDLIFEIRNLLGTTIVARQRMNQPQQVDVTRLVPGVYILIVDNQKGQIARPFVKM